jgi:hypothetical protein
MLGRAATATALAAARGRGGQRGLRLLVGRLDAGGSEQEEATDQGGDDRAHGLDEGFSPGSRELYLEDEPDHQRLPT